MIMSAECGTAGNMMMPSQLPLQLGEGISAACADLRTQLKLMGEVMRRLEAEAKGCGMYAGHAKQMHDDLLPVYQGACVTMATMNQVIGDLAAMKLTGQVEMRQPDWRMRQANDHSLEDA